MALGYYKGMARNSFRSVKFLREPEQGEWKLLNGPALSDSLSHEEEDAEGDSDEEYQSDPTQAVSNDNNPNAKPLKEHGRVIPQWTADRCINNLIYDLIEASGSQGLSTMVCSL